MKRINISKRKIVIISIIVIVLLSIVIAINYINSNSYKINKYLKQNYTSFAEFKNSGYILVKKDNKYGIIDYNKNEIFQCIYEKVNFIEYRDTYLILLKDSQKYILLNNKLEQITSSNNEIIVYTNEGYAQIWTENDFILISIEDKSEIAKGNIDIEKEKIQYYFNNGYQLTNSTKKIENEDKTISEETNSILYNSINEKIYENVSISIFNKEYLLLIDDKGYKLIDFYGKDVTISYTKKIKCNNGEIFLIDEQGKQLMKLKINKTEHGYEVIKEKVL